MGLILLQYQLLNEYTKEELTFFIIYSLLNYYFFIINKKLL